MPNVSIIMPAYNVGDYIGESIKSVLNQTYPDFELLIINDGSTDHTIDIINSFTDSRIKVINQKNQGVSVARNVGIDNAQGEYICFLDADDLYHQDYLKLMIANINNNIIYCGCYDFWEDGRIKHYNKKFIKGNILYAKIFNIVGIHINAILIKHNILQKTNIRFTPGCKFGEDFEFMTKLFCLYNCDYVPHELMGYRQDRKTSVCNVLSDYTKKIDEMDTFNRTLEFIKQNYHQENRNEIIEKILGQLYFVTYKAILVAIRGKRYDDAQELIHNNKVDLSKCEIKHKLRWRLIQTNNRFIWDCL